MKSVPTDYYIGLISGTSVDGIDAAVVSFPADGGVRLGAATTVPYEATLAERIRRIGPDTPLREVATVDALVGDAFARAALNAADKAGLTPGRVRTIGSHGQTVWHAPDADVPYTVQIGDPNRIAERTGITTVADFRRRDMAAGGEAAPLAPIFHAALLGRGEPRVVVNLGGISNITVLSTGEASSIIGCDCGPANTLLDAWCREHTGASFDRDGAWAATGRVRDDLLGALLTEPFFRRPAPRSTGPELFNRRWLEGFLPSDCRPEDVQATLVELTAHSVADAVAALAPAGVDVRVCGGGVHNAYLMERLSARLAPSPVSSSAALGVDPDAMEATGFAWLARETLAGRAGNVPAVTGARHPVVLGGIYRGRVSG